MSEILAKLFHSKAEVKIIRLFLNNSEEKFPLAEIAEKTRTDSPTLRKELNNLEKAGFLTLSKKNQKSYYGLNGSFIFLDDLKRLFFRANPSSADHIRDRVAKLGQVKLMLISGALINSDRGRVDLLIVGENIQKAKLTALLTDLEAEVGRSLRYVCMGNEEFKYRRDMFDKFVIDILDDPHKVLINNLRADGSI